MTKTLILVVVAAALFNESTTQALRAASDSKLPTREEELDLCSALESAGPGDRVPVLVSGIIVRGYEHQFFFDPRQPQCTWDVQPATWLEFAPAASAHAKLNRLLEKSQRAQATIRGELYGPAPSGPDDASLPPLIAYANRIAGRRYGHLGAFRTKLVVHEILDAKAASGDLASATGSELYYDVCLQAGEKARRRERGRARRDAASLARTDHGTQ